MYPFYIQGIAIVTLHSRSRDKEIVELLTGFLSNLNGLTVIGAPRLLTGYQPISFLLSPELFPVDLGPRVFSPH